MARIDRSKRALGGAIKRVAVPRNLPLGGKLGMHHSLQNYVVLTLPSVYADPDLEIYDLTADSDYKDRTREFMSLRDKRRSR